MNLTKLRSFYLHNNYITGEIPSSICTFYDNYENIQLYLHNNNLCPGESGYPECLTFDGNENGKLDSYEDDLGGQNTSNCP